MTYQELLDKLKELPQERLQDTVTVYDPYDVPYTAAIDTDMCAIKAASIAWNHNHSYLIINL